MNKKEVEKMHFKLWIDFCHPFWVDSSLESVVKTITLFTLLWNQSSLPMDYWISLSHGKPWNYSVRI